MSKNSLNNFKPEQNYIFKGKEISPINKITNHNSPRDIDNIVEISEDMIPDGNITDDCSDNSAAVSDFRVSQFENSVQYSILEVQYDD